MNYLIGIDLGTSSTKTVLFREDGIIVSEKKYEYPLYNKQELWAEQRTQDWLDAVLLTLKSVVKDSNISPEKIKSIGLSGQMHGLVMIDNEGDSIRNSIIWCDGRTQEECKEINDIIGANRVIEITGNPALTGFTLSKILWVRKNEPENFMECKKILLPKDYIRYELTGEFYTDYSDASGTNMLDIKTKIWSEEILTKLNLDINLLPEIKNSSDICGYITKNIAEKTGLNEGTPVVAGAADNAASAIGIGVIDEGEAFITVGTSGVIFSPTSKLRIDNTGRIHTFCSAVDDTWANLSCTLSAGQSVKWFVDNVLDSSIYKNLEEKINKIPIGSNKLIFLPYLLGERSPILDEKAKACFIGLNNSHDKFDMYRSILEGVAYSQKQCMDIVKNMGVRFSKLRIGGGGSSSDTWTKMFADVLNCKVEMINNIEIASLGAAILAGVGVGVFEDIEEAIKGMIKSKNLILPNIESHFEYMKFYEVYNNLYGYLHETFEEIARI